MGSLGERCSIARCLFPEVLKGCGSEKYLSLELLMLEGKGTMLLQNGRNHLTGATVSLLRRT